MKKYLVILFLCNLCQLHVSAQRTKSVQQFAEVPSANVKLIDAGVGWARNSVNVTVFRKNSLVTFQDTQFIAYYNNDGFVVLGKRKITDTVWQLKTTPYKGNAADAHNIISLVVDGAGYLHLSWNHHNTALQYCKSKEPLSLELTGKMPMTGKSETALSYPEFYKQPNGNLLFFYRDGGSGNGNLVIDQYDIHTQQWTQLHSNLIDGEGQRNAYWQACIDNKGTIHLSWVWRESPDVASNHDLCYARSRDGGITWENSKGEKYNLPITAATAEYALRIPQKSELINQTSMSTDDKGNPFIATYWREANSSVPQYHIVYNTGNSWQAESLDFRKAPFSLSGQGSKRIPIARPQILVKGSGMHTAVALVFRDEERGSRVSLITTASIQKSIWNIMDLTTASVGSWEPSYDTELWRNNKVLDLFVQKAEQADAEGITNTPPQMVQVLEWKPVF